MYPLLVFILHLSTAFGQVQIEVPYHVHQPHQWQELVTFINEKVGYLERLINVKDKQVGELENKLRNQNNEIMRLKEDVKSLQQVIHVQRTQNSDLNSGVFRGSEGINLRPLSASNESENWTKNYKIAIDTDEEHQRNGVRNTIQTHKVQPGAESRADVRGSIPGDDNLSYHDSNGVPRKYPYQPASFKDARMNKNRESKQKRVAAVQTIAFHSSLTRSVTVSPHTTVIFDKEVLDQGAGYNPLDGIYSVPESGTYVITWSLVADRHASFQTELIVNGEALGNSWTDADEVGDLHQTSATMVLTLTQGDHVFIRIGNIASGAISTEVSNPTFSGWKAG
ncbi:uncharacterized protein LOC132547565 [Ylistrum balloti]|uniref:uncharacterized protein LOC132547565 n=1 Tax=Ylistrum balloti TaxID=509963 RepID=UPI002905DD09|nr:uncharacterized protein LOC132547565 [Ylistrum balloti]